MWMNNLNQCTHASGMSVRSGKSKCGAQRYRCKGCGKSFQKAYQYKACLAVTSGLIVTLTKEGCGIRSIARLLQISAVTVIRRIRVISKTISRRFPILKGKEYELDEMRTFIRSKTQLYWIVYAMRKDTKEVVDFRVGKRTSRTLRNVVNTLLLSEAKRIFTDGYRLYRNLIPSSVHSRQNHSTNHIERKNLSLRTHLKRLGRRTICFSKCPSMLDACLRIYFWG